MEAAGALFDDKVFVLVWRSLLFVDDDPKTKLYSSFDCIGTFGAPIPLKPRDPNVFVTLMEVILGFVDFFTGKRNIWNVWYTTHDIL